MVLIASCLSYVSNLPNFLDITDKHLVFLFCNGILYFLLLEERLRQNQAVTRVCIDIDHQPQPTVTLNEVKQIEHLSSFVEEKTQVKQIERDVIVSSVDVHEDNIEVSEAASSTAQEEERDDQMEEANELYDRCEAFIKKMRQSMHREV
ncbi:hypothetical protein L1887_04093 [Cichorium endivia]|nr:hypothetical protein L1887_04093 [Cichorium endivia]